MVAGRHLFHVTHDRRTTVSGAFVISQLFGPTIVVLCSFTIPTQFSGQSPLMIGVSVERVALDGSIESDNARSNSPL